MDEVLFRSSQKLENFQVQLGIAAEQGKNILQHCSQQSKAAVIQAWNSAWCVQFQENAKKICIYIIDLANSRKIALFSYINPANLYNIFISVFGQNWTKQNICFGCAGLLLGGLIGFYIGVSSQKRDIIIRYMAAIQCTNYSGIESVAVVEDAIAPYECGKNEVLINVKAASVHIIDAQICTGYGHKVRWILGKYSPGAKHDLPVTLGRDCTGIVTDIGQNVTRFEVGDEVWLTAPFWANGTLSQTVLAHEHNVSRKPKTIGYEGCSSLPYAGSIAISALEEANLTAETVINKRVLIQGGCTPVGCVIIQLLKLWGAHVTITCFKTAVPVAQALGANDIIAFEETAPKTKASLNLEANEIDVSKILLKEIELRDNFDVIINTRECGHVDFQSHCKKNGQILTTLPPVLKSDSYGSVMGAVYFAYVHTRCLLQKVFGIGSQNFGERHLCYIKLDKLKELVENGQLQTVVDKVFHPSDIELALKHIQSPKSIGSTIITFR